MSYSTVSYFVFYPWRHAFPLIMWFDWPCLNVADDGTNACYLEHMENVHLWTEPKSQNMVSRICLLGEQTSRFNFYPLYIIYWLLISHQFPPGKYIIRSNMRTFHINQPFPSSPENILTLNHNYASLYVCISFTRSDRMMSVSNRLPSTRNGGRSGMTDVWISCGRISTRSWINSQCTRTAKRTFKFKIKTKLPVDKYKVYSQNKLMHIIIAKFY